MASYALSDWSSASWVSGCEPELIVGACRVGVAGPQGRAAWVKAAQRQVATVGSHAGGNQAGAANASGTAGRGQHGAAPTRARQATPGETGQRGTWRAALAAMRARAGVIRGLLRSLR